MLKKIDLTISKDKIINNERKNYKSKFCGVDSLKECIDVDWFLNYPIQNFDYKFNNWGFRGPDYEQYKNKPVVLCIGDSFTANIGGPISYSWPSLLQKHFDIPCLNFGVERASNDSQREIYNKAIELFDVKYTFVVYGLLHRRLEYTTPEEDIKNFEKNFINDAYYQFSPLSSYKDKEIDYIRTKRNPYLTYRKNPDLIYYWDINDPRDLVLKTEYEKVSGSDWCSYEEFLSGGDLHNDLITGEFKLILNNDPNYYCNRDGMHLNLKGNQLLADDLYNQFLQGKTK